MSTKKTEPTAPRQIPVAVNNFARFILHTPLHGLFSKHLILLTFKGRKSGKLFTTPVGHQQEGSSVICFTDHSWWKNLVSNPEVTLLIKGQVRQGRAEVVHEDKETIARELEKYARRSPGAARAFNIRSDANGQPLAESIVHAAQLVTLIRIQLND